MASPTMSISSKAAHQAAVASDEVGCVYDPYSEKWVRWPRKVVLIGITKSSVASFPQWRLTGRTMVHHNLSWLLPVLQSRSKGKGSKFGCASGFQPRVNKGIFEHPDFVHSFGQIIQSPASVIQLNFSAAWHRTASWVPLLIGLLQAAGIDVLASLESMSWSFWGEDLDLLEKFLSGDTGWTAAQTILLHNIEWSMQDFDSMVDQCLRSWWDTLPEGDVKRKVLQQLTSALPPVAIWAPMKKRARPPQHQPIIVINDDGDDSGPAGSSDDLRPPSEPAPGLALPRWRRAKASDQAAVAASSSHVAQRHGMVLTDPVLMEIFSDHAVPPRVQRLAARLMSDFGYDGELRVHRLLVKMLFDNGQADPVAWLENCLSSEFPALAMRKKES